MSLPVLPGFVDAVRSHLDVGPWGWSGSLGRLVRDLGGVVTSAVC